jgi:hypothetical protein
MIENVAPPAKRTLALSLFKSAMLYGKKPIQRAVLTMKGLHGEMLSLVVCADGGYGIIRNGEPVDDCQWESHELDACVSRLLSLAGKRQDYHA